jgi:hypothetical protein
MGGTALKTSVIVGVCAVLFGLPFIGVWLRHSSRDRCELDGAALVQCYSVYINDTAGRTHSFCCLRCAESWAEQQSREIKSVRVTDELTGEVFDVDDVFYVRSLVSTNPATGNRIHVFRRRDDAERHAETCRGTILTGDERPFARKKLNHSGTETQRSEMNEG